MNDLPARKYCDGDHRTPGDFKFQWWAACCKWDATDGCILKTTTQTEESESIDTRTNRQIDPSIKNHAHPTMPNAPVHANALNQADRNIMPIASIPMSAELHWSLMEQGVVLSAFAYGYVCVQLPSGFSAIPQQLLDLTLVHAWRSV